MARRGIYTLASGFPFSAYQNDDPSNTGTQGIPRPDQLKGTANLSRGQRTPTRWFEIQRVFCAPG